MFDGKRSRWLTLALVFVGISLSVFGGLALVSSTASADVVTDSANFTSVGNDTVVDTRLDVTNETRSVYVEYDNSSGNSTATVSATLYGLDEESVSTEIETVQVSPVADGVEMYEYTVTDSDKTAYSEIRVVVEGNSTNVEEDAVSAGRIMEVAGTGGGLLGGATGSSTGLWAIAGVVALAGFLLTRKD
jgi:hypothetical protein